MIPPPVRTEGFARVRPRVDTSSPPWPSPDHQPRHRSPEYEELKEQISRLAEIVDRLEEIEDAEAVERRRGEDC